MSTVHRLIHPTPKPTQRHMGNQKQEDLKFDQICPAALHCPKTEVVWPL